jgi:hypothetical protein
VSIVILDERVFYTRFRGALTFVNGEKIATGRALRRRIGHRRIGLFAIFPRHDQSTWWWFEQGLINLLAAAGQEITLITDADYEYDQTRLRQLDARLTVIPYRGAATDREVSDLALDAVIALTPSDAAVIAAMARDVPLLLFCVKKPEGKLEPLKVRPPRGTRLWHTFAASSSFPVEKFYGSDFELRLMGGPFPVDRFYFPPSQGAPDVDVLLFGSKGRDLETAFTALGRLAVGRVAALANPSDVPLVKSLAKRFAVPTEVFEPLSHVELVALLHRSRMVVNTICSPWESHYSIALPLATGCPVITNDIPSNQAFVDGDDPGVILVPEHDTTALEQAVASLRDENERRFHAAAARRQAARRHDQDRFFASAIVAELTR